MSEAVPVVTCLVHCGRTTPSLQCALHLCLCNFGIAATSASAHEQICTLLSTWRTAVPNIRVPCVYLTCELCVHQCEKRDSRVVVCLAPCCRGVRVDGLGNIWLGDVIVKVGTAPVNSVEDLVSYVETFEVRCSCWEML